MGSQETLESGMIKDREDAERKRGKEAIKTEGEKRREEKSSFDGGGGNVSERVPENPICLEFILNLLSKHPLKNVEIMIYKYKTTTTTNNNSSRSILERERGEREKKRGWCVSCFVLSVN